MMYAATTTKTRSATSTCTKSRVETVLAVFLGDVTGFICRDLLTRERALSWKQDLTDVLQLEAVERFQVKLTLPDGTQRALDYQISDNGQISEADECGGISAHWIPAGTTLALTVRWRTGAPKLEEARRILRERGWGTGSLLEATGSPDRTYSKDGYGLYRRTVGDWNNL